MNKIKKSIPTPEELRNAIYLDFEGEGKKRDGTIPMPHMAGIFRPNITGTNGKYESIFFNKSWKPIYNHFYKTSKSLNFEEYFKELLKELEYKKCNLIIWTIHEKMILEEFLQNKTFAKINKYIYNIHPDARKYANRRRLFGMDGTAKRKSIEEMLEALYKRRNPFPPFPLGAAEACRRIDTACRRNTRWRSFSDQQKSYAKDLVAYNKGDCKSTWLIAKKVGNAQFKKKEVKL
jgi:hypothetical protein